MVASTVSFLLTETVCGKCPVTSPWGETCTGIPPTVTVTGMTMLTPPCGCPTSG